MKIEIENEIIREIKGGNYFLFEKIIVAYQNQLTTFIYRVVKDEDDAKDICQDTFFKAYKSIKSFKGQSKFSTWLFQIGFNNCLNFIKKKRKVKQKEKMLDFEPHPSKNVIKKLEHEEMNQIINFILQDIPQNYRVALHLFYKEEINYGEIARVMNIPINTVKSHIHRGKGLIKQKIWEKYQINQVKI